MIQALNVCADTPYGSFRQYGDPLGGQSIHNALNWALKYQHEKDSADRSPTGGPDTPFIPYIPKCDPGFAWLCTGRIFVPNRRGVYLLGENHIPGIPSSTTAGQSAILFSIAGDVPCFTNQANTFVVRDLLFYRQSQGDTCIANTRVTSTSHPLYVADDAEGFGTGSTNTGQIQSRLQMTQCGITNFTVGIHNGVVATEANCDHHSLNQVYFSGCGTCWWNTNSQGVNITMTDCEALSCPIVAQFNAGGHLIINHMVMSGSGQKLLVLGRGGSGLGLGPGKNDGYFELNSIKTDTQSTDGGWFVWMDDETEFDRQLNVHINGGMNSRRVNGGSTLQQNRFARMVGRSRLMINGLDYPGQIECFGGDPEGSYPGASWAPSITMLGCAMGLASDADDPTSLVTGTYNSVQAVACDRTNVAAGIASPTHIDDVPDKPTRAETQALIEQYATYAAPTPGASGSIVWD